MTSTSRYQHAVVIGGSIAGLLTASALTRHFAKVTLIERDSLPRGAEDRSGTPQSKHPHNVLTRGMRVMESLIPGLEADLRANGVVFANWGKHVRTLTKSGWLGNIETDLYSPVVSRSLLEWLIRKHLLTLPNVTFVEDTQAQALITSDGDEKTVLGVRVKPRGAGGEAYDITADLVVDAAGRSSKAHEWLDELGYGKPEETTVDPKVGYATRLYKKPASYDKPWNIVYMPAKAPDTRGGAIFEIEGGIWMIALGGYAEDYPPNDEAGFIEYAKSLPEPDVYEAIMAAEPISDIVGYRRTLNIMRHYEKMPRFPEHFALVGDSVCGFNPIYGQGMTAAAMGAALLDETLAAANGLEGIGRAFQKKLAQQNATIWLMSTGEDFRHATTEGKRPGFAGRLIQRYMDWVIETLPFDEASAVKFLHVVNLDMPPTALFQPSVIASVIRHRLGRKATPQPSADAPLAQPR